MEKNQTMRRGCPLTGGAAIRMTQGAFDRCCQAKKAEALEEREKYGHLSKGFSFAFLSPCLTCSGPPAELTIIAIDPSMVMVRQPAPKPVPPPRPMIEKPVPQPVAKPAEKPAVKPQPIPQEKTSKPKVPTMKNKIGDLNDHLFAQLERLSDEELKGDDLAKEIARSKAVTDVAGSIIACGSLALRARLAVAKDMRPEQLPKMLEG